MGFRGLVLTLATALAAPVQAEQMPEPLPGGARWAIDMPPKWNGTLLLWSRGYSPRLGNPETVQADWREALLAKGYALAASDYGSVGWALAEAVPAQRAVVAAFTKIHGRPRRVIGWGNSMGGLVTTALAEQAKPVIHGGIAFCPSIGGAVGMMNMGLDGAFAFATLGAPDGGLKLTGISDDMANAKLAQGAVDAAMKTPEGRARLALAGVLGGVPGWTRRDRPQPAPEDYRGQVEEMAAQFVMGTFMPRGDQEKRAGTGYSWNSRIDYARQLDRSGRRAFVEALYREAGLDLTADLSRLAAAPRLKPNQSAVNYMMRNYTPTARPSVPLMSLQTLGDGATSPSLQQGYADAASPARFDSLWVNGAGHCGMKFEVAIAALDHLEARLDKGDWPAPPPGLIRTRVAPMLRPCFRGRRCL